MRNSHSHLTAIKRDKLSFPTKKLLDLELIKGKVLDFGCGFGTDAKFLSKHGFEVDNYDKFYFPKLPSQKYQTILCNYVLNVIKPINQSDVIVQISDLLHKNGTAFFAVRRDIARPGFRFHKIHQEYTYQCNVELSFQSIFKNDSTEIYAFKKYTSLESGNSDCPFCARDSSREILLENNQSVAFLDKYPVNKGHTLIIPKQHISNYFDLSFSAQLSCWDLVNQVKTKLDQLYSPKGYNIGLNVDKAAGQTVFHSHIHVIPRYLGDVEKPEGGIRGVIPSRKTYL